MLMPLLLFFLAPPPTTAVHISENWALIKMQTSKIAITTIAFGRPLETSHTKTIFRETDR